ncbi:hypothetical protein ROV06_004094 [Serratia marcescens]|nr:hypothetical protein [Serratia marcescens]
MKNIVENQGIKTDKPLPMSYEALKAERDALAVENQALKAKAAELVHEASEVYSAYNDTIREPDGDFMDMQTLYEMQRIETPATSAALAAIEVRGVEKFAAYLWKRGNEIVSEGGKKSEVIQVRVAAKMAEMFVEELREAK